MNAAVGLKAATQVQQHLVKADRSTLESFERHCGDGDFADSVFIDTVKDTVTVGFLCLDDEEKRSTMRFDFVFNRTNASDLAQDICSNAFAKIMRFSFSEVFR